MQCKGITSSATQCTRKASSFDSYCRCHSMARVPTTPAFDNWVSSSEIKIPGHFIRTRIDAFHYLQAKIQQMSKITDEMDILMTQRRRGFLEITSIIIQRPDLLEINNVDKLIEKTLIKMNKTPHLAAYSEYFARRFSKPHREKAKKRYIESVIRESILGQDIADVILGFM